MTQISSTEKIILYPPGVSNKWMRRFNILEFTLDIDGCLYSPKSWNDDWDNQTKALWLRSIGMAPENIAKKLNVKLTTVKNRWIDNITLHYKLKHVVNSDWSTFGYVNTSNNRIVKCGGSPMITNDDNEIYARSELDGEQAQVLKDYTNEPTQITNKLYDPYKEYYGDYKD